LADLSGVRSAYQPVITLTSQGPEPAQPQAYPSTRYVVSSIVNTTLGQDHPLTVRR
jgi:hypothetical protein